MRTLAKPVAVVITRSVRTGCDEAFEVAVSAWMRKTSEFPGHLGAFMLRPPPGGREYGAVLKFRSWQDWTAFLNWHEYRLFLEEIRPLLEGEPRIESSSGLEFWFTPSGPGVVKTPPNWKMAIVTWVGVNVITYILTIFFTPFTVGWPWLLGLVSFNAWVVIGLTWIAMPILGRLLQWWLFPTGRESNSNAV